MSGVSFSSLPRGLRQEPNQHLDFHTPWGPSHHYYITQITNFPLFFFFFSLEYSPPSDAPGSPVRTYGAARPPPVTSGSSCATVRQLQKGVEGEHPPQRHLSCGADTRDGEEDGGGGGGWSRVCGNGGRWWRGGEGEGMMNGLCYNYWDSPGLWSTVTWFLMCSPCQASVASQGRPWPVSGFRGWSGVSVTRVRCPCLVKGNIMWWRRTWQNDPLPAPNIVRCFKRSSPYSSTPKLRT